MYAGVRADYINKQTYIYSGTTYWTMSPWAWHSVNAAAQGLLLKNDGLIYNSRIFNSNGIRPVINLASNVEITGGVGTQNNPYIIAVD